MGTRLAFIVIAWNVFPTLLPYFDVFKTDWPAELPKALRSAATESGVDAFHNTLLRRVAALKGGHGRVASPHASSQMQVRLTLDWIENQLIVGRKCAHSPPAPPPVHPLPDRGELSRCQDGGPMTIGA